MKIPRNFLLALFFLAFAVTAFCAQTPTYPQPPDYFPLKVKDWWKYRWSSGDKSSEYVVKVVKAEQQPDHSLLYLVETTSSTQVVQDWYAKPGGQVQMVKTAYPKSKLTGEYKPAKIYLQNPLKSEQAWEWKGTGMMDVQIDEKNQVKGSEIVQVPAGKFQAVRVETDVTQGGSQVKKIYWFAPGVGLVKSQTSSGGIDSTSELIDYKLPIVPLPAVYERRPPRH